MENLIEVVWNDHGMVEHFTLHYRGVHIIFDQAEICVDKKKDRYVNRICRLRRFDVSRGTGTLMKAEIDEYKVVRQIEKELPDQALVMDPDLEMIEGGQQ